VYERITAKKNTESQVDQGRKKGKLDAKTRDSDERAAVNRRGINRKEVTFYTEGA